MMTNLELIKEDIAETNLEEAIEHGLSESEYNTILEILGRNPNLLELGLFSVMWSEHCSYKSTRLHLKKLPTEADYVICGPGENAGVIDIGDNQAAIFKMESHNHPSFIEPYQGAATGVGGILRDVFTMGARPIASMNSLRFGSLSNPKTRHLLEGVVAGVGGYGNCVGVPTVGGECTFHESYNGNILVNAMVVGLADQDKIFYSAATSIGSPVVYVGSKTGRDGIHGATMASAEFDESSEEKRPTVQVGDPFTEKLLIEACLELMATDAILAIQDMGAAGLTSSSLEMAGKGGSGIELHLEKVPTREAHMTPYEMMLSESQERMLMVIKPEKEELAKAIFHKWDLEFAIIGKITDSGRVCLFMNNEKVADLPIEPLSSHAPIYDRPYVETPAKADIDPNAHITDLDPNQILSKLLATGDLCSKRWIYEQYDSEVMNDSLRRSGSDAALVRVHNKNKALAISADVTARYCYNNPFEGGKQAVAECWRNITTSGARPLAITNCLNFGNPERPEIMGQLVGCLDGMSEACKKLSFPIVSGNVSLYNETEGKAIYPTPNIGGVGVLNDLGFIPQSNFAKENQIILLVGKSAAHIGSSIYMREIFGQEEGQPPFVDLDLELKNGDFIRSLVKTKLAPVIHDIADGGLYIAIAEMAMPNEVGATVNVDAGGFELNSWLFGEDQARYVIAVEPNNVDQILELAKNSDVEIAVIGQTGGNKITLNGKYEIAVAALKEIHESVLPNFMGSNS